MPLIVTSDKKVGRINARCETVSANVFTDFVALEGLSTEIAHSNRPPHTGVSMLWTEESRYYNDTVAA